MYTLAVQRDFVAQHFLIGGDWGPENSWHSHHYRLEIQLQGAELDKHGYLVDIIDVERHLDDTLAQYRDRTLNDLPDFDGLNPSIEHFTRLICEGMVGSMGNTTLHALVVKIWENEIAWASYRHEFDISASSAQRLTVHIGFIVYGSLDTISGGYLYDRALVNALHAEKNTVQTLSLPWRNYARHLADNLDGRLFRRLTQAPFDLLIQDELNHPSLVIMNRRLRRRVRYPIVSIVHHLRSDEDLSPALMPLYRYVESQYLRTVDAFIFNSRSSRDAVSVRIGYEPLGLIAYPAADHLHPPSTDQVSTIVATRCQLHPPLKILFVGNLIARKGLHTLLRAVAQLPAGSWRLNVVGSMAVDPFYVRRIRHLIQQMNLTYAVNLLGAIDDVQLRAEYEQSHVLAVPSFEGFGIVYLEAMSYGLPAIASTCGTAWEVISPGAYRLSGRSR